MKTKLWIGDIVRVRWDGSVIQGVIEIVANAPNGQRAYQVKYDEPLPEGYEDTPYFREQLILVYHPRIRPHKPHPFDYISR